MPDITPNLRLKKPLGNETVSRAAYNENLDIIDENTVKKGEGVAELSGGTLADRPSPGIVGRYYFAQDTGEIYLDIGTGWILAAAGRVDFDNLQQQVNTHLADYASFITNNAVAHNSIYRGKYLGSSVTAEQYLAISTGAFTDLYIGDYWTIGGVNYRIAAFDYYYNTGDTAYTSHHVVIVPDTQLYSHVMNDTDITTGGYTGSKMYLEGLEQAKTTIRGIFGTHVVNHRKYLCNAVTDGIASGGAWFDSEVELMNEVMVYGTIVNGHATYGLYNIGTEKTQLPLFALNPRTVDTRQSYWLRDVTSATHFAYVSGGGLANHAGASRADGVRPVFSIRG